MHEPRTVNSLPATVVHEARLAALAGLNILDTPAEQGFEDIVRLATRLCAAPVALVSLVAADRQWFKANIGFPHCETDLDASVCVHALGEPDLLVIPDLTADPRTAANSLVTGEPFIRFYAGAPLRLLNGHVVGSLCVIDVLPRPSGLMPEQADDLRALGRQVSGLLEMRRAVEHRDVVLEGQRVELRQARRLDLLAKASSALIGATDPAAVLEPILIMGAPALGFDLCFIYDVTPDGQTLRLVQSVGADANMRAALSCVDRDVPLCGIVVDTRHPLVLEDVQASVEPRYAIAREAGINAYAGYPITSRGQLVSVVSFASQREAAFDAEALSFFATLARLMSSVRDRLDTDTALRASDTRSRLAQEAAHIGTFEVDVATNTATVSAEMCRIYGVPETLTCSIEMLTALVVPEDRAIPSNKKTIREGTAEPRVEYRIRRADDGEIRWILRQGRFERDDSGNPLRMFGTVQDVTDRHDDQAALRISEASARRNAQRVQLALAAGAIIGTWNWHLPSDRFAVDEAFAKTFGLDPAFGREGIPLARIVATVHPEDQDGLAAAMNDAVERCGTYAHQYRVRRADGRYYWIEANGRVDRGPDGTALSFSGVLLDIEARRASQEALRASEGRLHALVKASNQSIYRMSPDWQEMRALDGGGFLNDIDSPSVRWLDLYIDPADRPAVIAAIEDAVARRGVFELEHRVRGADGTLGWTLSRAVPIFDQRGDIVEWFGAASDVTGRKRGEERQVALIELGDRTRDISTVPALAQAAAEIIARVTGAPRAGYGVVDIARETVEVLTDWCTPGQTSLAGPHHFRAYGSYIDDLKRGEVVAVNEVAGDPRTRDTAEALLDLGILSLLNVPIVERGQLVGVTFVTYDQIHIFTDDELSFLRVAADRIQTAVVRIKAEEDQRLLNEEMSHRLKNSFAMVLSIAGQSLRTVSDRAPVMAFEQRILALSSAHDVLLHKNWTAAPAKEVVRAVLAGAGHGDRIDVSGPEFDLGARATLSLSLLLHELATNAAKYGAFSVPHGRVAVDWRLDGDGEHCQVTLDWRERGGPSPVAPVGDVRKGFGSRLIGMGLTGKGGVELRFSPLGFEATMRASLVQLQYS